MIRERLLDGVWGTGAYIDLRTVDVHVDGAQVDVGAGAPDPVEQALAAEHAARTLHQEIQQPELGGPQVHVAAGAGDAVAGAVQHDVGVFQPLVGELGPAAAQQGAQAGDQLGHGEGLDQVVVRAGVQAAHLVGVLAAGGQHQHGGAAGLGAGAQTPADLYAGDLGKHPVEHDQVGGLLLHLEQGLLSIGGALDAEALLLEVVVEQGGEGVLVLDQQNVGGHSSSSGAVSTRLSLGRSAASSSPVIWK